MTPRAWPEGISVIVRLHDPARLPLLEEALFSLAVQRTHPLQVVVVLQGAAVAPQEVTHRLARQPFAPADAQTHIVEAVEDPDGVDLRARLLNRGIALSRYRYLAFLDDDDVVYQSGYQRLIDRLRISGAALAAGGTVRADFVLHGQRWVAERRFDWVHSGTAQRDLFERNFLPLHSFVIDRTRLTAKDLRFEESLTRLEDYDFLLRLAARHRFDLNCLDVPVCEYRLRRGADNVNPLAQSAALAGPEWTAAREHIDALKRRLAPEFERMPHAPAATASGDWWRATQRARLHVGGWIPLLLRVLRDVRQRGVRRLLSEARRFARRS